MVLVIIAKIILAGSIVGIAALAVKKIPSLRKLPAPGKKKRSAAFSLSFLMGAGKNFKGYFSLSQKLAGKIFSGSKKSSRKRPKERQTDLSEGYWEKIRRE